MNTPKRWDRESVAIAILSFWKDNGHPPTILDWDPAAARRQGHEARARRCEKANWPSPTTVRRLFGSWSAAMAAVGFDPPTRGRPRGVSEQVALERDYKSDLREIAASEHDASR